MGGLKESASSAERVRTRALECGARMAVNRVDGEPSVSHGLGPNKSTLYAEFTNKEKYISREEYETKKTVWTNYVTYAHFRNDVVIYKEAS